MIADTAPRWLLRRLADVPDGDAWLTPEERATLATLRFPKRRNDWRLGRWTAHAALTARWPSAGVWSVRPRGDGSPEALLDGAPQPVSLSISHSAGVAMAAVAPAVVVVGCDVERVEDRSRALVEQFFTGRERATIDALSPERRALAVTMVWSAKESALKALRVGLREDTRAVEVTWRPRSDADPWAELTVVTARRSLRGAWRVEGDMVITLVADPWARAPVRLDADGRIDREA